MATSLSLTSGGHFSNNPITIQCTSDSPTGDVVFHRIIFHVTIGGHTYKFSQPVTNGQSVEVDISSAFRAYFDAVEFSPTSMSIAHVGANIDAYDEFIENGELKKGKTDSTSISNVYYGGLSDFERISGVQAATRYSSKPTSPEVVAVGSTAVIPKGQGTSTTQSFPNAGTYQSGKFYAVTIHAGQQPRVTFRFINRYGCLESINVPRAASIGNTYSTTTHVVAKPERFNAPSHALVRKLYDFETWNFLTDPLDEQWLKWYAHEFFMAEHVWMLVGTQWVRCHIIAEEEVTIFDRTNRSACTLSFKAQMDINGLV